MPRIFNRVSIFFVVVKKQSVIDSIDRNSTPLNASQRTAVSPPHLFKCARFSFCLLPRTGLAPCQNEKFRLQSFPATVVPRTSYLVDPFIFLNVVFLFFWQTPRHFKPKTCWVRYSSEEDFKREIARANSDYLQLLYQKWVKKQKNYPSSVLRCQQRDGGESREKNVPV